MDTEEFQDKILFYREQPPLHHHLTTLITNLANVCWVAPRIKKNNRFKRKNFIPDYRRASMSQEEKAAEATENMKNFFDGLINGNR